MKKTIIQHPLRTIELMYRRDRLQTEWEKETIATYIHLHDDVWRLKAMCEEYRARLDKSVKQLEDIHRAIRAIHIPLGLLEAVVGIRAAVHVYREDDNRSFLVNLNDFSQKRDEISEMMKETCSAMTRCREEYHSYVDAHNTFDGWFEAFDSGPMLELYQRYDEVSVDTVALDRDHQNLLEIWQPIIWAEREYQDKALSAFMNYDELEEITGFLFEDVDIVEDALRNLHDTGKSGIINIQLTDDGEYHAF